MTEPFVFIGSIIIGIVAYFALKTFLKSMLRD